MRRLAETKKSTSQHLDRFIKNLRPGGLRRKAEDDAARYLRAEKKALIRWTRGESRAPPLVDEVVGILNALIENENGHLAWAATEIRDAIDVAGLLDGLFRRIEDLARENQDLKDQIRIADRERPKNRKLPAWADLDRRVRALEARNSLGRP